MGGKKRKNKNKKNRAQRRASERAPVTEVTPQALAAAPVSDVRATEPVPRIDPEEVIGAIVQSIVPPLFESSADADEDAEPVTLREARADDTESTISSQAKRASDESDEQEDEDLGPHSDHRAYPRVSMAISIGLETESHFFSGLSGDVSEGGVFVQTYREIPVGSEVELEFELPTGHVATHGKVRWHRTKSDSAPPGVGIAFEELPDDARSIIHEFCEARAPLYYDVEHA
jgi:uncharacterized protein (TIGR02266 family)